MAGVSNTVTRTIDNLLTSTWYDIRDGLIDQVFKITPYWDKMFEKGRIKSRVPSGTHFEYSIRYEKADANTKWFGRSDTFGRAERETLTRIMYETRNLGTAIPRYWEDDLRNSGPAKILDYIEELLENTKMSLVDKLEVDSLTQNADPLAMNALPTLISTTPTTGSLGGLDRSQNTWMTNQTEDFSGKSIDNDLLNSMMDMYNKCSEFKSGNQRTVDLILTTRQIYQDYETIAQALQTIETSSSIRASLGFGNLLYKNVEMFWSPNAPAGNMYFLNTETLELPYNPNAWMHMTPWKEDVNGPDRAAQILCVLNQVCTNFQKNGVIHDITSNFS